VERKGREDPIFDEKNYNAIDFRLSIDSFNLGYRLIGLSHELPDQNPNIQTRKWWCKNH